MGARVPRVDTFEREIEAALEPGRFVSYRAGYAFVASLEEVHAQLAQLVPTAPARAIGLYETFVAGCYEKAEEVDDSSGSFGMFVTTLVCGWVKARQAAGTAADETASRLLAWMDDDPYGFCYRLEREVAPVLNRAGLAALIKQIRQRYDAAVPTADAGEPAQGAQGIDDQRYARRRWGEALRTLYVARKDIDAYLELAEHTGLTADDCLAVARMLSARRKPEQALSWVERGIEIEASAGHPSFAGHELTELKPRLLKKLGRDNEALATAWAEYHKRLGRYTYQALMTFVPNAERPDWHQRAMDEAMDSSDLGSVMELLLHTNETERLAQLIGRRTDEAIESVSYHVADPAASRLEKGHPGEAARIWSAQGIRILKEKRSKAYDAALRYFEQAKRCYERAGQADGWHQVVAEVNTEHRGKYSFMPRFEKIASGSGPSQEPGFLDRAKARWAAPHRDGT